MHNKYVLFLIFLLSACLLNADIYVYISKDGQRTVSNFKPANYSKIIKVIKSRKNKPEKNKKININSKSTYKKEINEYSNIYNVDPELVKAIIKIESGFNSKAVSKKGAKGLMQLMESTARLYGVKATEIFKPEKNIKAGIKHLKRLINKYKNNLQLALAAYNAGEAVVDYHNAIPPYRETINYVKKVFREYKGVIPRLNISKKYKNKIHSYSSSIKAYYDKNGVLCISNIPSRSSEEN